MYRIFLTAIVLLTVLLSAQGQERVTPRAAKGGAKQGAPWAEVPASFRNVRIPEWPLPTDLERWRTMDRARVHATLRDCLGDMPARPDPRQVRTIDAMLFDTTTRSAGDERTHWFATVEAVRVRESRMRTFVCIASSSLPSSC